MEIHPYHNAIAQPISINKRGFVSVKEFIPELLNQP